MAGLNGDEVTTGQTKFYNQEIHDLYLAYNIGAINQREYEGRNMQHSIKTL
jgi:hypothetical protein